MKENSVLTFYTFLELMDSLPPAMPPMSLLMTREMESRIRSELAPPAGSGLIPQIHVPHLHAFDIVQINPIYSLAAKEPMHQRSRYKSRAAWKQASNHWRWRVRRARREDENLIWMLPKIAESFSFQLNERTNEAFLRWLSK